MLTKSEYFRKMVLGAHKKLDDFVNPTHDEMESIKKQLTDKHHSYISKKGNSNSNKSSDFWKK
jgi:hypothetical protein